MASACATQNNARVLLQSHEAKREACAVIAFSNNCAGRSPFGTGSTITVAVRVFIRLACALITNGQRRIGRREPKHANDSCTRCTTSLPLAVSCLVFCFDVSNGSCDRWDASRLVFLFSDPFTVSPKQPMLLPMSLSADAHRSRCAPQYGENDIRSREALCLRP